MTRSRIDFEEGTTFTVEDLDKGWLRISNDPPITRREYQSLVGTALGMTRPEIAETMGVGHETVRVFMRRMFDKLGARSGAHAVAIAYQEGILDRGW